MNLTTEINPETLSSSSSQVPVGLSSFFTSPSNFSNSSGIVTFPSILNAIRISSQVIGGLGVIGNFQVIVVMLSYAPLRRRLANYYLINQCVVDLLVSICVVLLYSDDDSMPLNGVLGEFKCRLWLDRAIVLGLINSSLYSLAALAVERYLEIVYPIQHKLRMTRRMVLYSLVVINLTGVSYKIPYMGSVAHVVHGVCVIELQVNPYIKQFVGVLNLLVEFLVPLTIIGFCYVGMARSLNRKVQPMQNNQWNQARRNIFKTLLFIVLFFVVCTTLRQLVSFLNYFSVLPITTYSNVLANIAIVLAYSNCCFTPLIYFFKYKEFQRGFRWLYCRRRCIKNWSSNGPAHSNDNAETKQTSERY